MTLIELINASAQRLTEAQVSFGHGTTNAHDEAVWLVLWSLGLPLNSNLSAPETQEEDDEPSLAPRPVSTEEQQKAEALIARRITTRKPAAYLTQEAWLQGVAFYVDERVIVPRSLIGELLVEGNVDYWLQETTHNVLDLCTGNGSLAILAAMVYPEVDVVGADISADALAVARINVERHGLHARVHLTESDGLSGLHRRFDLILCNPPYVNAQSMAALPPEYQAEPALALDGNRNGGSDGMDFIRTLLRDVARYLKPGGVLVLEVGNERENFERAFPGLEAVWLPTSAGEDQVLLLTRENLAPVE